MAKGAKTENKQKKLAIDKDMCIGCGHCADSCPEVFKLSDESVAHVISQDFDKCGCDIEQIRSECPVGAIVWED